MSAISRAFEALRTFSPKSIVKGYGSPGSSNLNYLLNASNGYGPHEPFAGAWQKNLDNARGAGPNILAFSGVYTCINIISSDIAQLSLQVLKKGPKGNREKHPNHPAWRLLQNPNSFQTSLQFVQQYMISKLTQGNTYVLLLRDARGVVNEMYVLDPTSVQPLVATDGSIFYRLGADTLNGLENPITVRASEILHDRCAPLFHPLIGTSPLFAAGVSAMMGSRVLMNSETFFANMSRAAGVLTTAQKVDPEIAKDLQAKWEQNYGASGLGRTAILSNGLEFKPMTITAADAELVNQLRWTIEDVARCFRVPGFKLGDLNRVTFKNSEQMSRDYYKGCLSFHINAFETCMDKALGLGGDVQVEFDLSELFRMETDIRYQAHKDALNAGWMSINEVRQVEDLPPVKGGEEPRVQIQYVPLSMANGLMPATGGAGGGTGGTPASSGSDDQISDPAEDDTGNSTKGVQTRDNDGDGSDQLVLDLEDAIGLFMQKLNGADNGA